MLPFADKSPKESLPYSDSLRGNARVKVEQDIEFLTDRIAAMRQQARPNVMLIEHYQAMLKSRESVLKWLMDGCDDETATLPEQHRA